MITILKKIWDGWKKVAHAIGTINAYILLSLFYFIIVGVAAILRRLFGHIKKNNRIADTFWREYQNVSADDFKRQF